MAKANYLLRLRSSGASALSSMVCNRCYRSGARVAFFGVELNGGTTLGSRAKDHAFQKEIWGAAKKHMKEEHGLEFISNGHVDGYNLKRIKELIDPAADGRRAARESGE